MAGLIAPLVEDHQIQAFPNETMDYSHQQKQIDLFLTQTPSTSSKNCDSTDLVVSKSMAMAYFSLPIDDYTGISNLSMVE
jgi:hypothetical protein